MKLCSMNTLIPALYFNATVNHDLMVGPTSPGPVMLYGGVKEGYFHSEPNFPVKISASVLHTGDFVTVDPDQQYLRNDIQGLLHTSDDAYIRVKAFAIEQPNEAIMKILGGDPTAKPVEYGDFYGVSVWSFDTGSPKYKELENKIYVGSTRLELGPEPKTFSIAFKISQVSEVVSENCTEVDSGVGGSEGSQQKVLKDIKTEL